MREAKISTNHEYKVLDKVADKLIKESEDADEYLNELNDLAFDEYL